MIVAFDPGVTTGIVTLDQEFHNFYEVNDDSLLYKQQNKDGHTKIDIKVTSRQWIINFLNVWKPNVILCEPFHHRPNLMKAELFSKEIIGVIRLWCDDNNKSYSDSNLKPGDVKPFWTDRKIKALHLWQSGMPHAMDALRVLLAHRWRTDEVFKRETLQILKNLS